MSGHPLLDGKAFDSSMVGVIGRVFDCAWSEIANQRGPRHRKAEDRSPTGFGAYLPLPLAAGRWTGNNEVHKLFEAAP